MRELVFPLSALAVTLLIVAPALTALALVALARRRRTAAWADFGDGAAWAWLVAPTALPLVWLLSAVLHQLEPGRALEACRVDHLDAACVDALVLVGLVTALAALARRRTWITPGLGLRPLDGPPAARLAALVAGVPALRRSRVWLVDGPDLPAVFTFGAWRPVLAVRADFARAALAEGDPERLVAALLHEAAHARGRDVLRQGLMRAALWLNPAGRWLRPDAERWLRAREAACDREAVALGADPLALAQSLVRAAGPLRAGTAGLCGHDALSLRLRVALLLQGVGPLRRSPGPWLALALLAAALIAPHVGGQGLLDHFHHAVERWG